MKLSTCQEELGGGCALQGFGRQCWTLARLSSKAQPRSKVYLHLHLSLWKLKAGAGVISQSFSSCATLQLKPA